MQKLFFLLGFMMNYLIVFYHMITDIHTILRWLLFLGFGGRTDQLSIVDNWRVRS